MEYRRSYVLSAGSPRYTSTLAERNSRPRSLVQLFLTVSHREPSLRILSFPDDYLPKIVMTRTSTILRVTSVCVACRRSTYAWRDIKA